jgi:hypothetical protein
MGIPYDDVSSDEELDLRVREVRDAVDIYSYEVNIDDEEDQGMPKQSKVQMRILWTL